VIYQALLAASGATAESVVLVDDREPNLRAAAAIGLGRCSTPRRPREITRPPGRSSPWPSWKCWCGHGAERLRARCRLRASAGPKVRPSGDGRVVGTASTRLCRCRRKGVVWW
jgi:hypothetical protein